MLREKCSRWRKQQHGTTVTAAGEINPGSELHTWTPPRRHLGEWAPVLLPLWTILHGGFYSWGEKFRERFIVTLVSACFRRVSLRQKRFSHFGNFGVWLTDGNISLNLIYFVFYKCFYYDEEVFLTFSLNKVLYWYWFTVGNLFCFVVFPEVKAYLF